MTFFVPIFFVWLTFFAGCAAKENAQVSSEDGSDGFLRPLGQGICQDVRNGRMWQVERGGKFHSSQEAQQYVANLRLGGHSDWRMPTQAELFDLYYIYFWHNNGDCDLENKGNYWAMDDQGNPTVGHWETYYLCGPNFKYNESLRRKGYVRAVRQ